MASGRRRLTRRLLLSGAASAAGVLALAVAACGGASAAPESGVAPHAETKTEVSAKAAKPAVVSTLMVLRGQRQTWVNAWHSIFAGFEAAHPAYKLEVIGATLDRVPSRALTTMAAGFTFDAIYGNEGWLGLFVDAGIIQSLNPFLSRDADVSLDDFYEFGLLKHKGTPYSVAWQLTGRPFWFNTDKFAEAGLKTPAALEAEGNWTWEAVLDAAARLTKRDGDDITFGGLQIHPMFTSHLPSYAWAWGADLWNEDCTQAGFNTPEFADAAQYCVDLFARHRVIGGNFLAGTQGMVERATGGLRRFEERITARGLFAIGMAPRPRGPDGERATAMTASGVFIGERANNAEGAWDFIKYTVSAAALPEIAAMGQGRFTASKRLEPLTLFPYENAAYYKQMARDGRPVPQLLRQDEFTTAWRATWGAMVEGSLTVVAGLAKTQEQVQGWLDAGGCLR